tara:strand:+ start:3264 stop:4136 length:873 start_codon:yes stop_codon:yes gene_type:complete
MRVARARILSNPVVLSCAGAALLYLGLLVLYPYGNVATFSFWSKSLYTITPDFQFGNYARLIENPLYATVIGNSLRIAAAVTLVSGVLGYVLAYFLARQAGQWRNLLVLLLMVPLWTSFLLRAYVWKIILGRSGILAGILSEFGIAPESIEFLLYSDVSVAIALTYIFIPFVALPVFVALDKIPSSLTDASADLGASPARTFVHVVFPLTLPGLIAGATIVFCLSFGDFIAPTLLGGSDTLMIATVIIGQFGAAFDWPFGSALAMVVLVIVLAAVTLSGWLGLRVLGSKS